MEDPACGGWNAWHQQLRNHQSLPKLSFHMYYSSCSNFTQALPARVIVQHCNQNSGHGREACKPRLAMLVFIDVPFISAKSIRQPPELVSCSCHSTERHCCAAAVLCSLQFLGMPRSFNVLYPLSYAPFLHQLYSADSSPAAAAPVA
jgi:hypothetical protein